LFHASVTDEQIGNAFFVMRHNPRHIFLILTKRKPRLPDDCTWPENVWLGVTVCNQEEADAKIPYLAKIPAAIRYVSIEPMLGPVDIVRYLWRDGKKSIHWVICGGESGPGARPLHPSWVLRLLFQCKFYDIPFFFKQWGHCMPGNDFEGHQYLELPLPLDRYLALSSGHDAPHARWMR
jgi:protein gp37